VGNAARSAEQYNRTGATSYSNSTNIFSPEFLYDLTKVSADCGSGSSIMTALDYIKANGICRWQTLPYSYTDGCSSSVSTTAFSDAANYKIPSYSGVYKSDIAGIKAMLQANHPLIFMVNLDNSFVNAPPGFIWKSYTTGASAGHAMVIVGYDDSKNAWRVMNSWGASWCENGYGWIDYNFFPQTGSAWTFVMNY
jgi:C1A family cysteine protease